MKKDKTKSTVLIISMGFLLIHIFSSIQFFLYLSLAIGILGLSDKMSQVIDKLWMGLSKILSYIIPNILLTLVFYLVLFPFAVVQKFIQKDPLHLLPDRDTYWVETNSKEVDPKSFEKTW